VLEWNEEVDTHSAAMAASVVTLHGELNLEDRYKDVKTNSTAHAHTSKLM